MRSNLGLLETPRPEDPATQQLEAQPHLTLVPPYEGPGPEVFINADNIPELSIERQKAAQNAAKILGQNRHLLHNGQAEKVPTPIDALGTARQVVAAKRKYGPQSPIYQDMFNGMVLDSERLLAEATTKNKSEYFARKTQQFEAASQEYFAHGLSVSAMTRNGLSPTAEPEEQSRRINEHVEEDGTYVPLGRMIASIGLRGLVESLPVQAEPELPGLSVQVTTISECTDYAERDYEINPKGSHSGYRPAMKGIAIRRVHFEDDSGDREEEQVIISGIYITHELIEEFLAEKGGISPEQNLSKTELQGTQFISVNEGSVMEFVKDLDEKASAKHSKNLFMGEEVPADHPKDYGEFMEEAEERRKRLAPMPTQLAQYLESLQEKGTPSGVAERLVNEFLKAKLLAVAKKNPELAEAIFDKATAEGFAEVARLEALGDNERARRLQEQTEEEAPEPSYCGAGSCGIEAVDSTDPDFLIAKRLGLKGKLLYDKERACPKCKAKKVHYGENGKACTGCGHNDVGGRKKVKAKEESEPAKVLSFADGRKARQERLAKKAAI